MVLLRAWHAQDHCRTREIGWGIGSVDKRMTAKQSGARATGRRAVLVTSPNAGNAKGDKYLAKHLERVGIVVAKSLQVSDLDHAQPQGARWREHGYDLVIAAGGDGTIGSVATQLAGSDLPLAILPMGTSNDVARSFHVPMGVDEACVAIAGAVPLEIDIGQVLPSLIEPGAYSATRDVIALAGDPSPLAGACFMHAVTLGLNVEFARLATDSLRRQWLGSLTYAASALEAVTHYHPVDVTLHVFEMEGEDEPSVRVIHTHAVQVCVVNTPLFGGRMGVRLPGVNVHDRQLDFMLIEAIDAQQLRHTVQQLLSFLGTLADRPNQGASNDDTPEAPGLPGVRRFRARAAIIETADAVDMTLDGEIRTHTPVLVRVAPFPIHLLVSPQAKLLLTQGSQPDVSGAALD